MQTQTEAPREAYGLPVTIEVLQTRYGQDTRLRVSGELEPIKKWLTKYLRDYNPAGYDTRWCVVAETPEQTIIETNRSHTCD
jgi:hypothetical protein